MLSSVAMKEKCLALSSRSSKHMRPSSTPGSSNSADDPCLVGSGSSHLFSFDSGNTVDKATKSLTVLEMKTQDRSAKTFDGSLSVSPLAACGGTCETSPASPSFDENGAYTVSKFSRSLEQLCLISGSTEEGELSHCAENLVEVTGSATEANAHPPAASIGSTEAARFNGSIVGVEKQNIGFGELRSGIGDSKVARNSTDNNNNRKNDIAVKAAYNVGNSVNPTNLSGDMANNGKAPISTMAGYGSSAKKANDNNNAKTVCPLCEHKFVDPLLLGCFHTFCKPCLELVLAESGDARELRCPRCTEVTKIRGDTGLTELMPDFSLVMIQEEAAAASGDHSSTVCTGCKSMLSAAAFCSNCDAFLCVNCVMAHKHMLCFDGHLVRTLDEMELSGDSIQKPVYCRFHKNHVLKMFCSVCDAPACKECIEHSHKGPEHLLTSIGEVGSMKVDLLKYDLKEARIKQRHLLNNLKSVVEAGQALRNSYQSAVNNVIETTNIMLQEIEVQQGNALAELEKCFNMKKESSDHISQKFEAAIEKMNRLVDFADRLLTHGSPSQVLVFKKLLDTHFQSMNGFNPDLNLQWHSELEFQPNLAGARCIIANVFTQALQARCPGRKSSPSSFNHNAAISPEQLILLSGSEECGGRSGTLSSPLSSNGSAGTARNDTSNDRSSFLNQYTNIQSQNLQPCSSQTERQVRSSSAYTTSAVTGTGVMGVNFHGTTNANSEATTADRIQAFMSAASSIVNNNTATASQQQMQESTIAPRKHNTSTSSALNPDSEPFIPTGVVTAAMLDAQTGATGTVPTGLPLNAAMNVAPGGYGSKIQQPPVGLSTVDVPGKHAVGLQETQALMVDGSTAGTGSPVPVNGMLMINGQLYTAAKPYMLADQQQQTAVVGVGGRVDPIAIKAPSSSYSIPKQAINVANSKLSVDRQQSVSKDLGQRFGGVGTAAIPSNAKALVRSGAITPLSGSATEASNTISGIGGPINMDGVPVSSTVVPIASPRNGHVPGSYVVRKKMLYHCKFGEFGSDLGQFAQPSGLAVSLSGSILVADSNNNRLQVFSREGQFEAEIGVQQSGNSLMFPNRVAVDPATGNIVVTERNPSHQIQVFDQFGQFLRKFGGKVLQHPRAICIDPQSRIIVVECKVMRVVIFTMQGDLMYIFSLQGYLDFPNSAAANDKGEIFISDNKNHCVKVFDYSGTMLRQIGGIEVTNYPIGVKINSQGHVVVADNHGNFNVTVFEQDGTLVDALESKAKHPQVFDISLMEPGSVVVASKDYKVYIFRYA